VCLRKGSFDILIIFRMSTKPSASNLDPLEEATHGELVALVRKLLARVEALEAENATLREELRESKRAKAPFSKGKARTKPKRPGRRAGEGRFATRPAPEPGPADVIKDVPVPLDSAPCPQCGAHLDVQEEIATVEDTPPEPVRIIKRFRIEAGNCPVCGWRGRQHDCGRVLLFLERPEIEPTNNRAERGLRGAGMARKVSHCSKNERGAGIYESTKSVTATMALRGQRVVTGLANLIMGHPMQNVAGR